MDRKETRVFVLDLLQDLGLLTEGNLALVRPDKFGDVEFNRTADEILFKIKPEALQTP